MATITYNHLVRHIVPGPQSLPYFGPFILLPLSLSIPRSVLGRWQNAAIFLPLITLCCIQAWRDMDGVDVISVNCLLWSVFMIALHDPRRDFRLVVYDINVMKHNKTHEPPSPSVLREIGYPSKLGERLLWIGKLLASIRLDNWRINHPSHDKNQPPAPGFSSRREFLLHALLSFVRGFAVLDLTRAYIEIDPYYTNLNKDIRSPLPFSAPVWLPPHLLRTMIIGAQAWALIGQMFYLPATLPVLLNGVGLIDDKLSPHNWPPYFGSPAAIFYHGVRGFWGTFWHQTMRWTTTGPGYAIVNSLSLNHKGLVRYAILSAVAFFLSGVVHMGLVPPEPLNTTMHVNSIRLHLAGFFWVQAIAVALEALVARVVIRCTSAEQWNRGSSRAIRVLVNATWVIAWFDMCLPLLGEAARQLGYWKVWPLPISMYRGLLGDGYLTWLS